MKKILFALMAVCTMAFSFTSCDNQADPTNEPIAGKQYYIEDALGSTEFQFHMDHSMTAITKFISGETIQSDNYTWSMKNPNITIKALGKVCYTGVYHPETSSITIKEEVSGSGTTFELKQKGGN